MRRGLNRQYHIRKLFAKLKQRNIIQMDSTAIYFQFVHEPWLRQGFKEQALSEFRRRDFTSIEDGDNFFAEFGAGNSIQEHYDALKQARFDFYQELLDEMQTADPAKYQTIFKGFTGRSGYSTTCIVDNLIIRATNPTTYSTIYFYCKEGFPNHFLNI